jgi:hypothetical protein
MKRIKKHWIIIVVLSFSFFINAQTQIGNDIDGLLAGDNFGTGVSISSDGNIVAVVGFSGSSGDGRIRVFENIGEEWVLYGTDNNGENFGGIGAYSVSLSADGHTLAFANLGTTVEVFNYNTNTGIWTQKGNSITNNTSVSNFGYSIKLSSDGNTLAIGAPESPIVPDAGVTQIFQIETDSWNQIGNAIIGLNSSEHSGRSVDISSNGEIVAILNDDSARVYQNIANTWTLLGSEIPAQGNQSRNRAVSLSSNGEILAIGEPDFSDSFIQRGRVRVFNYTSGTWNQIGNNILGEVAYYKTGASVSLSSNGQLLAIGETGSTSGSTDTGRTRLFKNQNGLWVQIGNEIFGESSLDYSGSSISLSSNANTIVIGSSNNDGNGIDSGHARVFNLSNLLSIDNSTQQKINLFPNPVRSQFTIELHEGLELKKLNIYTSLGQLVLSINTTTINTSNLLSGMYYVEIKTNKETVIKKIVIQQL